MCAATLPPLRIAVALSGGVDSSVAALFLQRCLHTDADLAALRHGEYGAHATPRVDTLCAAVQGGVPWSQVVSNWAAVQEQWAGRGERRAVELAPLFIQTWLGAEGVRGWCAATQADYDSAQSIAHDLGLVPRTRRLAVVDLAAEYAERCFDPMLAAFAAGRTLNVDVLCNSEVKLGALVEEMQRESRPFRAELLATGHYGRTVWWDDTRAGRGTGGSRAGGVLLGRPRSAGCDLNDQTVFLSHVGAAALGRAVFPLGHLFRTKADVRAVARRCGAGEAWACVARKKTSTGLCFVGEHAYDRRPSEGGCAPPVSCALRFAAFLGEHLPVSGGPARGATRFVDAETGEEVPAGHLRWDDAILELVKAHGGFPAFCFTVGQRLRCVAGVAPPRGPLYVCEKVVRSAPAAEDVGGGMGRLTVHVLSEVRLVRSWDHPLLYARVVWAAQVRAMIPLDVLVMTERRDAEGVWEAARCLVSVRHQQPPAAAWMRWKSSDVEPSHGPAHSVIRRVKVVFDTPVRAPAAGQALVVYRPLASLPGGDAVSAVAGAPSDQCVVASGWIT